MKDFVIPDEIVEYMRQFSEQEDNVKFQTAGALVDVWEEYGMAIAHHMRIDLDAAHRQFIERLSAQVGIHHSTLYSRARVGRNWVARGYHEEHDAISYGVALELMRNIKSKDGIVDETELAERINWWYNELEEHGSPPGTRTVRNYFRKNGDKKEWELCWNLVKRNANKFQTMGLVDTPDCPLEARTLMLALVKQMEESEEQSWFIADVVSTGGEQKT